MTQTKQGTKAVRTGRTTSTRGKAATTATRGKAAATAPRTGRAASVRKGSASSARPANTAAAAPAGKVVPAGKVAKVAPAGMAAPPGPARAFKSQAAWGTWLARHHAKALDLWVKFAKKDSGIQSIGQGEAVEEALRYGWIDSLARSLDADYWMLRFTPRGPRSKWSQINCAKAEELIAAGRMEPAGLAEVERAKRDGRWAAAYAGPRAAKVPDDLQAALSRHQGARTFFESLDGRNRYAILYRIHDAKTPETRARRIAKFMEMLKAGEKIYP